MPNEFRGGAFRSISPRSLPITLPLLPPNATRFVRDVRLIFGVATKPPATRSPKSPSVLRSTTRESLAPSATVGRLTDGAQLSSAVASRLLELLARRALVAVANLKRAVVAELVVEEACQTFDDAVRAEKDISYWRKRCARLKRHNQALRRKAHQSETRTDWKLNAATLVRVGLSNPDCSARAMEEHMASGGVARIERGSVCHVRHAFAQVVQRLSCQQVAQEALGDVVFLHLRDEAAMRMRSTSSASAAEARGSAGSPIAAGAPKCRTTVAPCFRQ